MRQLISGHGSLWARRLLAAGVVLYFVLGLGLLTVRYALLPQIDHWRPQIAQKLSDAMGGEVTLGALSADWRGWDPGIRVRNLSLRDDAGRVLLQVPEVRARLNWRALLPGHQGLLRLQVRGMTLTVERLKDGRIGLLGFAFALGGDSVEVPGWLRWALVQPVIAFRDVKLRWVDHVRQAPPLLLEPVDAVWSYSPQQGMHLQASASAPAAGGARVQVRAAVPDLDAFLQGRWPEGARAWLKASNIRPTAWRTWVPGLPAAWQQGGGDLEVWVQESGGVPVVTLTADADSLGWADAGDEVRVPQAQLWMQGPADQWQALMQRQAMPVGLAFELRASGSLLHLPQWFAKDLQLGEVSARGRVLNPGAWRVQLAEAHWQNEDVTAQASGQWQAGGEAGTADVSGTIARLRLPALAQYLPLEVSADAREWLGVALQTGDVSNGRWRLRGALSDFPFSKNPADGDFQIQGDFQDTRIDLVPDKTEKWPWPLLQIAAGKVDLQRMDLQLQATQAFMAPASQHIIALRDVKARIPDMEHAPVLTVSGLSAATGATYVALLQQSPLKRMLNGIFDEASATGDWNVPLALTVPLLHSHDTRVEGRVDLKDASLQFLPEAPAFQKIDGQVFFTEDGIRIVQPLKASLLGGAVQVRGELGSARAPGLAFQGRATARALGQLVNVPGMKRMTGSLAYQGRFARQKRGYALNLESDTTGLVLDFPAPLSKPAGQPRTLKVQWTDSDPQDDALQILYGSDMRVELRHARTQATGPYFQQAAIGIGQAAAVAPGLQVDIAYPLFDLDLWNRLIDEFSIVRRSQEYKAGKARRTLWPDLRTLSVQADQLRLMGTRLDHAVLRVVRSPDDAWSMNVRSRQTTGTVKWQEQGGRVQGKMSARFSHLSLGDDPRDNNALLPDAQVDEEAAFDDDLEIPAVALQADRFDLYGRPLGALSLDGERDGVQHIWNLRRLIIERGKTRLQGTGVWRLRGPNRGLSLDADIHTDNFGGWMNQAGWKNVLVGGAGTLKGQFEWRNLPWTHDKADLSGALNVSLDRGRFPKLGSHTAKLLEFLSLQSIARLTKLDSGLSGLLHEGVPFDQLRGSVSLSQGVAQVHDYKVIGSIGTIVLDGTINILKETLDLQAVVVPNLDVSGAALAAGIAINPLVGLGAFITQWLLKTPLARAMTAHYHIVGTWDDPKVKDIPVVVPAPVAQVR